MSDGPKGVVYNEPPPLALPSVSAAIDRAVADMAPGQNRHLDIMVDETGINGVLVMKIDKGWDAMVWMGKTWGKPGAVYGTRIRRTW